MRQTMLSKPMRPGRLCALRCASLGLIIGCVTRALFAHPGEIDATFSTGSGAEFASGGLAGIYAAVLQPDGKIVLGGGFERFNRSARNYLVRLNRDGLVRLNRDGSLDAAFNAGRSRLLSLIPQARSGSGAGLLRWTAWSQH